MNDTFAPKFKTADLYDAHGDELQVAEPLLVSFGGRVSFHGPISTIQCFEDNSLVREAFSAEGDGRVLVIDGGGSLRCALIGDQLAALAEQHHWAGAIVHGCVRDSAALSQTAIGIMAIAANPRKSLKKGAGERNIPVRFVDVTFTPGDYLYVDEDGIVTSSNSLLG